MTIASLTAWIVAASLFASGGVRKLTQPVAEAMAEAAMQTRMVDGNDGPILALASIEVALAWFETGGQMTNSPTGSNDGGNSFCWAQIYLPNGAKTAEGWTGVELRDDPKKCAKVAVRLIKTSADRGPADCELCLYARGRVTEQARALSRNRMALARRLLTQIHL